eukprot:COSAG04_NODE_13920_length_587_cov_0.747951_1_plen_112_part_00
MSTDDVLKEAETALQLPNVPVTEPEPPGARKQAWSADQPRPAPEGEQAGEGVEKKAIESKTDDEKKEKKKPRRKLRPKIDRQTITSYTPSELKSFDTAAVFSNPNARKMKG